MRIISQVADAVDVIEGGDEALVRSSAGIVFRWRKNRGDLVIDRPPENIDNKNTADERATEAVPSSP